MAYWLDKYNKKYNNENAQKLSIKIKLKLQLLNYNRLCCKNVKLAIMMAN